MSPRYGGGRRGAAREPGHLEGPVGREGPVRPPRWRTVRGAWHRACGPTSPSGVVRHTLSPTRNEPREQGRTRDRKSTRLNSSHANISYAVFCLKKKKRLSRTLLISPSRPSY